MKVTTNSLRKWDWAAYDGAMENEFNWTWLGADVGGRNVVYRCGLKQVARMHQRLDGTWYASLDCHLSDVSKPMRIRSCTSFEAGCRGIELWAERYAERIRREVEEDHQRWLARQTWRQV